MKPGLWSGGARAVLQEQELPQKHAAFPRCCSRLIREDVRKLALCAHEEPKGPSALRAQCYRLRCRLAAPYGSLAIVFATVLAPAVLTLHTSPKACAMRPFKNLTQQLARCALARA